MIVTSDMVSDNQCLDCDICIVGSGPAGISIAVSLIESNKKIIMLTGGLSYETIENQDFNKGIVFPLGSHEPLEENRRRAFGGTSIAWGGRCVPLDRIDFEKREWIPNSGWPIKYDEILPYYEKASKICDTGLFEFDINQELINSNGAEIIANFDNEFIVSSKIEKWSPPVNFAKTYYSVLKKSDKIQVLLNSHLISLETGNSTNQITKINAIIDNKSIVVKSKVYVLACGAIENCRLLLSSKSSYFPNGIGNDNDLVGRYYMSHLFGIHTKLIPKFRDKIFFQFEKDQFGVYCRRRWWITNEAQKEKKIGNAILFIHPPSNIDGHRDPLFSFVYIAKYLLSLRSKKSFKEVMSDFSINKKILLNHIYLIFPKGIMLLPKIFILLISRLNKRRLPFILPSKKSKELWLFYQTEHLPNPNSRVTISDSVFDKHGIPRAIVNICFSELDRQTINEANKIFYERFKILGIGKIYFNENELTEYIETKIQKFNSAAHHIGTTRMSENPKEGVVDENCKVHGIQNLYIAGSSVFPTGGHVNPTFTIVALSIRLAEHLNALDNY